MKVTPTEADFEQAYIKRHFRGWQELKREATHLAAVRLLEQNQARQTELIKKLETVRDGEDYLRVSDAITRAFAEHDTLMTVAYPETAT